MNNDPFAALEEEPEDEEKGLAWLPLTLAAIALVGFLTIPVLGFFHQGNSKSEWADFTQEESLPVSLASPTPLAEYVPATNPDEFMLTDLSSVDETLSNLGSDPLTLGVIEEPKTEPAVAVATLAETPKQRVPPVSTPSVKEVAALSTAAYHERTVQPGDTLYGISREYGASPREISRLNGLEADSRLQTGQILRVPGKPVASSPTAQVQPRAPRIARPITPQAPVRAPLPDGNTPTSVSPLPPKPEHFTYGSATERPLNRALLPHGNAPASVTPLPPRSETYSYGSANNGATNRAEPAALPKSPNPLEKYGHAIAYRVQSLDNLNRIADAHATTPQELIEINGRSQVNKGEMLIVPVDKCLIKNGY